MDWRESTERLHFFVVFTCLFAVFANALSVLQRHSHFIIRQHRFDLQETDASTDIFWQVKSQAEIHVLLVVVRGHVCVVQD